MPTRAQKASALFALAASLLVPRAAAAQEHRTWDVFGGYAFLHDAADDVSLPTGWTAAGAVRIVRWLSIVADASGHYKTVPLVGGDARVSAHSVLVGGRASISIGKLVEFVQVLAGPVHTSGSVFGVTASDTHAASQAGIGLDVPIAHRVAARVEVDGRLLNTGREFRAVAGLVVASRDR